MPKYSQLRCIKNVFNRFILLISVCLRTALADHFHNFYLTYLHKMLTLLLFHTYCSLLPSDIIVEYNFCSLKNIDQKLRFEDHIVVLVLIFSAFMKFLVYILCAVFVPLFNFLYNFCVACLVTLINAYATRIPDTHGFSYSFSARPLEVVWCLPFKPWIKSHLLFDGIISLRFSPR
jgi:hypothetical protein